MASSPASPRQPAARLLGAREHAPARLPARTSPKRRPQVIDPWEEEADALAEWLARAGAPSVLRPEIKPVPVDRDGWGVALDQASRERTARSEGRPLDPILRADLEERLDQELPDVRVHTGEQARAIAGSVGAEALTLGSDIFLARTPDRALIAHEVVHTLQQAGQSPRRAQAKITRAATEIDARVEELIKAHIERDRNASVDAELDKVAVVLRDPTGYWNLFRKEVEPATASGPVAIADVTARVKKLCTQIRKEHGAADQGLARLKVKEWTGGDQVQNAVASMLGDYLRSLGEHAAAAVVVSEFPYSSTYLLSNDVLAKLTNEMREIGTGPSLAQLDRISPALAAIWPGSVVTATRKFMRLPPTKKHDDARRALIKGLDVEVPEPSIAAYSAGVDMFDGAIDPKQPPGVNELVALGPGMIEPMRNAVVGLLNDLNADIQKLRGSERDFAVAVWKHNVDKLKSTADHLISFKKGSPAHALGSTLATVANEEASFWKRAADVGGIKSSALKEQLEARLEASGLSIADAMLQDSVQLLALVDELGASLKDGAVEYFRLREGDIAKDDNRRSLTWLFHEHADFARQFALHIDGEIAPSVVEAIHTARADRPDQAKPQQATLGANALGWFAQELSNVRSILEEAANLSTSYPDACKHFEARRGVAFLLGRLAYAMSGRTRVSGDPNAPQPAVATRERAKPWSALADRADLALSQGDIQTSVLVMPNPIMASDDSTLVQLNIDQQKMATGAMFRGFEPFTTHDLLTLIHKRYQVELQGALDDEMKTAREAGDKRGMETLWTAGRSLKRADTAATAPQRFHAPDARIYEYAGDPYATFGSLLSRVPDFQAWLAKHQDRMEMFNVNWGGEETLWIWLMPKPVDLVRALYEIPTLRGLVQLVRSEERDSFDTYEGTVDGETVIRYRATEKSLERAAKVGADITAPLAEHDAYDWYRVLRRLVNYEAVLGVGDAKVRETDPAAFRALQAEVAGTAARARTALTTDHEKEARTANAKLREATTMDRRVVERIVREQLKKYDDSDMRTEQPLSVALENIDAFRRSVRPYERKEVGLQTAALVMLLSDQFRRIYGTKEFMWLFEVNDLPLGFNQRPGYRYIHETLAYIDDLPDNPGIVELPPALLRATISVAKTALKSAMEPMKEGLLATQWRIGISGSRSDQTVRSHLGVSKIQTKKKVDEANKGRKEQLKAWFPSGGLQITIEEVLADFVYLPGTGERNQALHEDGAHAFYMPGRVYVAPKLMDEDTWEDPDQREKIAPAATEKIPGKGESVADVTKGLEVTSSSAPIDLVRVNISYEDEPVIEEPMTITSHDLGGSRPQLVWLTNVVHQESNSRDFRALGEVIQGFYEVMKFVASFHPAGRWGVMIIEAIELVNEVLSNPDFLEQLKSLRDDPVSVYQGIRDELATRMTLDGMFDFLLNGNFDAPNFAHKVTPRGNRKTGLALGDRPTDSKKLLTRIWRFGSVAAMRLERFQDGVQRPLRVIEASAARNPTFSSVLAWAGENASEVLRGGGGLDALATKHPIAGPVVELYLLHRERERMKLPSDQGAMLDGVASGTRGFVENFEQGLDAASKLELPKEIVSIESVLNVLIELIIEIAKRSKNKKAKAFGVIADNVKNVSDKLGIRQYVLGQLAMLLDDTALDPNTYWQKLLPPLGDSIKAAINDAASDVGSMLGNAPVIGGLMQSRSIAKPSSDQIQVEVGVNAELDSQFEGAETDAYIDRLKLQNTEKSTGPSFHAIQGLPDGVKLKKRGGDAAPQGASPALSSEASSLGALNASADAARTKADNQPLPSAVRASAERRFGHDFSGVRLSQGVHAGHATAAHGADALTTGSHIQLRPDMNPSSGRGARVLDHELSHVLQKRAPLPRGGTSAVTTGLRSHGGEEAAADRMAADARRNTSGAPVRVSGAHRDGASPSISADLLKAFLLKMSGPIAGPKLAHVVEHAHAPDRTGPDKLEPEVERQAEALWKAFMAPINAGKATDLPGGHKYLQNGVSQPKIVEHLRKRMTTVSDLSAAGNAVAYLAAGRQVSPRGKPKGAKKQLQIGGFLDDLVLYVAGRSGVVLEVTNKPKVISSPATAPALQIEHLEMHLVRATTQSDELWSLAIANTWATDFTGVPADEVTKRSGRYLAAARDLMREDFGAPVPDTATAEKQSTALTAPKEDKDSKAHAYTRAWDSSATDLKLDSSFKARVEARVMPPALDAKVMPPWQVYVGETRAAGTNTVDVALAEIKPDAKKHIGDPGRAAKIGLHLSTHKDITDSHNLETNDRNSHHITQFLLAEYFNNEKGFKPFPRAETYPGVAPKGGGAVSTIASGDKTIFVGKTFVGRGGAMPALSLAASTHRMPLHVTPVSDENGSFSQGFAIHEAFQKSLMKLTDTTDGVAADTWLRESRNAAKAPEVIYQAVRQTYRWIWRDEMESRLKGIVPGAEAAYYLAQFPADSTSQQQLENIHGGKKPEKDVIEAAIKKRVDKAITHMEATLNGLGWIMPAAP